VNENNMDELNKHWSELKKKDYTETFPAVENWLRNKSTYNNSTKKRRFSIVKDIPLAGKLKLASVLGALILIGLSCNIPVTQNETIGFVLSWSVDKGNKEAIARLEKLGWIDKSQLLVVPEQNISANINKKEDDRLNYKLVIPTANTEELRNFQTDLGTISGINTVELVPLFEQVKRPVYSAALNKLIKVDLNFTSMPEEDLEHHIEEQLKTSGVPVVKFNLDNNPDGRRIIHINTFIDSAQKSRTRNRIRIQDGNDNYRFDSKELENKAKELSEKMKTFKVEININDLIDTEIMKDFAIEMEKHGKEMDKMGKETEKRLKTMTENMKVFKVDINTKQLNEEINREVEKKIKNIDKITITNEGNQEILFNVQKHLDSVLKNINININIPDSLGNMKSFKFNFDGKNNNFNDKELEEMLKDRDDYDPETGNVQIEEENGKIKVKIDKKVKNKEQKMKDPTQKSNEKDIEIIIEKDTVAKSAKN